MAQKVFSSCHLLKLSHNTACIYHCSKCLKPRKINSWVRDLPLHLPTLFSLFRIHMKQLRQFLAVFILITTKCKQSHHFNIIKCFFSKGIYIFSNGFFPKGLMSFNLVYSKQKVFYLRFSTHLSI